MGCTKMSRAAVLAAMVCSAVAAFVFSSVSPGLACEGDNVLLAADFATADASWGAPNANYAIKDGSVLLKPDPHRGYKVLDNAFLFDDADICVTATALEIDRPEESAGGLAFWAQDYRNAYFLLLATNGLFKIARLIDAAWVHAPLDWTRSDAIVEGIGKPNALRLTIADQMLTVAINGKPVTSVRAQPPAGRGLIGLYAESGEAADCWKFNDLKVTDLKKTAAAAPAAASPPAAPHPESPPK